MITLGWIIQKPLALLFDPFHSLVSFDFLIICVFPLLTASQVLYISGSSTAPFPPKICLLIHGIVQTVGYVVADGKSNWLEGMILMCTCPSPASFCSADNTFTQACTSSWRLPSGFILVKILIISPICLTYIAFRGIHPSKFFGYVQLECIIPYTFLSSTIHSEHRILHMIHKIILSSRSLLSLIRTFDLVMIRCYP